MSGEGRRPGWETILADLALILFVFASAKDDNPRTAEQPSAAVLSAWSEHAELPLAQWAKTVDAGPAASFSIIVEYQVGNELDALKRGANVWRILSERGVEASIHLARGDRPGLRVEHAFDRVE